MRLRTRAAATMTVAALLVLTGCTDSPDPDPTTPAASTPAATDQATATTNPPIVEDNTAPPTPTGDVSTSKVEEGTLDVPEPVAHELVDAGPFQFGVPEGWESADPPEGSLPGTLRWDATDGSFAYAIATPITDDQMWTDMVDQARVLVESDDQISEPYRWTPPEGISEGVAFTSRTVYNPLRIYGARFIVDDTRWAVTMFIPGTPDDPNDPTKGMTPKVDAEGLIPGTITTTG